MWGIGFISCLCRFAVFRVVKGNVRFAAWKTSSKDGVSSVIDWTRSLLKSSRVHPEEWLFFLERGNGYSTL